MNKNYAPVQKPHFADLVVLQKKCELLKDVLETLESQKYDLATDRDVPLDVYGLGWNDQIDNSIKILKIKLKKLQIERDKLRYKLMKQT